MARTLAIFAAALIAGCSTSPPSTGPGTATIEVLGRHGECHSFGGCAWVAILSKPDEVETLTNRSDAELRPVGEGPDLVLGHGLPAEIETGHYRLTFEERYMSDDVSNIGPRDHSVSATCATDFIISAGKSVVVARVMFPQPDRNGDWPVACTAWVRLESAS